MMDGVPLVASPLAVLATISILITWVKHVSSFALPIFST